MDNDLADYCREVTDYVLGRATAEGSIQTYYEQNFSDKKSLWELINEVVTLHIENEDYDQTGKEVLSSDDEYAYISEMTGVSAEVAELLVWLHYCYMMKDGCVSWNEACPTCGHGELYEREVEGGAIYESYFECAGCGTKYSFEEVLGDPDEEMPLL